MTRDQFISAFFIALLVFIVYEIFLIFWPFSQAIFWAAILAFGFYPVYDRLKKALRTHDILASMAMTTIIFLIVIPPVVFLIVNITSQAIDLYQAAAIYIRDGKLADLIDHIRSLGFIHNIEQRVIEWEPLKENAAQWLLNTTKAIGNLAAAQAGTLTKNIFIVILNLIMMFFLIFVFLKDGQKIYDFVYSIAPMEHENKQSVFSQINETFSAVIRGQLLTSITQSILAGIIFWILGVPAFILFAAATFLAALIPVLGPSIIWLPISAYLFFQHHYVKAGILFFFGLLVISLVDNLIKPALIGEKTKLPYFLLFFGILGGIKLYGLVGIFLGPVVLSVFFSLIKIYEKKYL